VLGVAPDFLSALSQVEALIGSPSRCPLIHRGSGVFMLYFITNGRSWWVKLAPYEEPQLTSAKSFYDVTLHTDYSPSIFA